MREVGTQRGRRSARLVERVQPATEGHVGKSACWQGAGKGSRKAKPLRTLPRKAATEA